MKNDLELLKQIQDLDREIYASRQMTEALPGEIRELDQALEVERATLHALEEELKVVQLKQKEKEAALQDKEATIKKYEVQLDQVKTNKEYAALQSEIRSIKADNSLLEEGIIGLFDEVDQCQERLKTERSRLSEIEKSTQEKKAALEQEAKDMKQKSEALVQKKKELIKSVNPEIANLYERIVSSKRGIALSHVEGEVCSACQVRLRPQQLNELQIGETIVLCEQCSRILYHD
ncbi:MAG: hypothetical protein HY582_01415 [Candidatus Omnitrophica bacterium]|nr:hypothetical protein [Candidatus Omnitrophota bacterium]